jgi:integrase
MTNNDQSQPTSTRGPQSNVEAEFEPSDRSDVRPGVPGQEVVNGRVLDTGSLGDASDAGLTDYAAQVASEQAHDLSHGVVAGLVGPVAAAGLRRLAPGTSHAESLGDVQDAAAASTSNSTTSRYAVGNYQHLTEDELAVVKKIDSYTPKVNPKDWAQIETFVRDAIRDAEPDRYSTAQPWLSCVSQLVMWSWKVECLPLERDVILEPANIFAYVEQRTGLKDASQATTRAILLNISKRLLGENAGATEDRRTYANRAGRTPYTSAEKIALRSFVRGQATDLRRRNVRVIIALGAGAGLTAVDLMLLMPEHIEDQGDQILVHVPGDKPRTVPLIAEWEDLLRDSMVGVDRTMPLVLSTRGKFRYGNAIADFLYSCNGEGVRPHCQRLRSTWFVDQLNARTPLNVVLEAAGVTEVSTLGRYLKFLAPVQAGAAAEFLRLGDSA